MVKEDERTENKVFSPLQTRASRKAKTAKITAPSAKATRTRTKIDPKQKLIVDSFVGPLSTEESGKGQVTVGEAVTASWDDHDGPTSTPVKDVAKVQLNTRKRTRNGKTNQKVQQKVDEATPEKRQPAEKPQQPTETKARKKLQLAQAKVHILKQCCFASGENILSY